MQGPLRKIKFFLIDRLFFLTVYTIFLKSHILLGCLNITFSTIRYKTPQFPFLPFKFLWSSMKQRGVSIKDRDCDKHVRYLFHLLICSRVRRWTMSKRATDHIKCSAEAEQSLIAPLLLTFALMNKFHFLRITSVGWPYFAFFTAMFKQFCDICILRYPLRRFILSQISLGSTTSFVKKEKNYIFC